MSDEITETSLGVPLPANSLHASMAMRLEAAQAKEGRRYSGKEPTNRALERRERLIESGLEIIGSVGYANMRIQDVCRGVNLSERYFYEFFSNREEFLLAVVTAATAELFADCAKAASAAGSDPTDIARATLGAFIDHFRNNPVAARITMVETVGISPVLEARRRTVMQSMAQQVLTGFLLPGEDFRIDWTEAGKDDFAQEAENAAVFLVAGICQLALYTTLGKADYSRQPIINVCEAMILSAKESLLAHRPKD